MYNDSVAYKKKYTRKRRSDRIPGIPGPPPGAGGRPTGHPILRGIYVEYLRAQSCEPQMSRSELARLLNVPEGTLRYWEETHGIDNRKSRRGDSADNDLD